MKHLLLHILLIFLLALPFTGCQKHYPVADKLSQAEIYMNEEPEAALRVLESIGQPDLHTKEHHARYALLYSQALDKNYIDKTNDSLINVAVDYYRQTDEVRSKFLSCYYKGRIHRNAGENPEAMLAFMEAEQLVDALGDDYYAGLLYQWITAIYESYMDYPKAMEYAEQSIDCYTRAGKNRHRLWALMEKSSLLRAMNEDAESIRLMEALLPEVEATNDMALFSGCLGDLILGCLDENRLADARKYYDRYVQKINPMTKNTALLTKIAQLYAYEGSFSEAQRFMEAAWEKANDKADSIILYVTSSLIHRKKGNDRQAYADLEKGVILQNKNVRKTLQQPILTTQMDFLRQELKYNEYKLRMEKYIRLLGFIILLLVSIIILAFLRKKFQKRLKEQHFLHEKKMEELQQEALKREESLRSYTNELETKSCLSKQDIDRLNQELEESKKHIEEARIFRDQISQEMESLKIDNHDALMRINKTLKNHFKQIENTYQVLQVKYKNAENRDKAIEEYMRNTTAEFYGSKKADRNLEKLVNELYGDTMRKFRKEIKLPAEDHYRLVCLLLAGLSINFIAALTGETTNAIYKRREKIRDIIKKSDSLNKSTYLLI